MTSARCGRHRPPPNKDRKKLLRTLLDEVNITAHRDGADPHADLVLRWKGGAISELTVPLHARQPTIRTSEDTPRGEWEVLITDHHGGFIDWDTYHANQARIGTNIRPQPREPGTGAVREGCALLQGLATCGTCGRKLAVFYRGPAKSTPGYYCQGSAELVDGRGVHHMNVGATAIDAAVADAFLAALAPAALQACLAAAQQLEDGHDAALAQHRRQVEQARYRGCRR